MPWPNSSQQAKDGGLTKRYTAADPLVFIHVPKTAGRSVWQVFQSWFGHGLVPHYFHEPTGSLPQLPDLSPLHAQKHPVCIYGHFNRLRGFGVEYNCPEAHQFVTILRDPFEMAISHFYYAQARNRLPANGLQAHLENSRPNMLNHFPRPVSMENFKDIMEEFFVAIGITEALEDSLSVIGQQLGHPFKPEQLAHINQSTRDQQANDTQALKAAFQERHPLEYAVYAHACHLLELRKKELPPVSGSQSLKDRTS